MSQRKILSCFLVVYLCLFVAVAGAGELSRLLQPLFLLHPQQSGAYVLDKGEEALLARAWLTDHAEKSIDVQYFIWSSDNIGTLATERLLRAAERGVKVRVLVDDLLVDAPNDFLLAMVAHENIDVRVYNPLHRVGVSKKQRFYNVFSQFRASNQRMHDKTFIVDSLVAITGGRNMADEYFDYDHEYNFRDRDILLLGPVARDIDQSFESFWNSELARPVEELLAKELPPDAQRIVAIYQQLHAYADDPVNFTAQVHRAVDTLPLKFASLIDNLVWGDVHFISDEPGKNSGADGLGGGGRTTASLIDALRQARSSVTIQSPYLVLPQGGLGVFKQLIDRGVRVRISTNSLLSTDNLQAFSGYSKQRKDLLKAGIDIYEFKPQPRIQRQLIERYEQLEKNVPIFAIHAKTLVIDGRKLYIGTFNLDPRSANLNTEVGVIINNAELASLVDKQIERDMHSDNSWDSRDDNPNRFAPLKKRMRLLFWKMWPLDPIL